MASARRVSPAALLALALLVPPLAAPAADDAFLPLRAGTRWEYEIHRDHTYRPAVGPIDRSFRKGSLVLEDFGARDGGAVHELLERRTETPTSAHGVPPSQEQNRQLWSVDEGVRLHGVVPEDGAEIRFEPPLRMLPAAAEPGARWAVGTWRTAQVAVPLEAEALAREDVGDGAERWEDCLKVRYTGPVSGGVALATGQATIREGRIERLVWWKPGVGPVREVTTNDAELELPDGSGARVHEVVTVRLVRRTAPE